MTWKTTAALIGVAALANAAPAVAEGELHIFNWGNTTNPELIEKFEKEHDVDVTLTDYDSNDTAIAKVRAGGHGFDIVVRLSDNAKEPPAVDRNPNVVRSE